MLATSSLFPEVDNGHYQPSFLGSFCALVFLEITVDIFMVYLIEQINFSHFELTMTYAYGLTEW